MLPNPMSSAVGTKLTARSDRTKSAFGRIADNKCSGRAFPIMTDVFEKGLAINGEQ
jgi:hypothetical protein